MKNFIFYNREAESFWLILGCRGVLGFLLVFQIIPRKYIIRTPQEPNLKSTEKDALNGPSGSDHLAPHSVVLGLAMAPGDLLGRQFQVFFKSYWIRTHILKFSRSPDLRSTGLHTQLGVTSTKGVSCLSLSYVGLVNGLKVRVASVLSFPCFSCPLDGEPDMGNSEACPWLSWGGPRWDTSWSCRTHVWKCWRHSISKKDLCFQCGSAHWWWLRRVSLLDHVLFSFCFFPCPVMQVSWPLQHLGVWQLGLDPENPYFSPSSGFF